MDDLDLVARQPDALDLKARERLRDRDDPRGAVRERALHEAKRARAERVVVVLRRHEPPGAEGAVDVGVHEVRVHEVGPAGRVPHAHRQQWIEVARRGQPLERHAQRRVERIGRAPRIVEAEEADLDAALRERREQGQEMALRAADAADAVDVEDVHGTRRRRPSTRSKTAAASSARRKSVGIR